MPTFVLDIPGWRPALDNELIGVGVRRRYRLKRADVDQVGLAGLLAKVPKATGPRHVGLTMVQPRGAFPDPTAPWKSLLDALVSAGLLLGDRAGDHTKSEPEFRRGPRRTIITLTEKPKGTS